MWAMGFTSRRSRFTEHARVGFRAEAPGKVRAKQSEAAVAEALRLALSDACRYRLVLIDRGAEGAVRHVLHPEERDVPADSPLANRPPPPSRSELILVARLSDDCHRGSDRAILETTRIMDHLGVEKLDGLCVPWPEASEDAPVDPNHTGPDCRRQKKLFLRTWKALHKKLVPDRVRWLGTELLDAWQLERVVEDVSEHERPVFNLIEMDISAPRTRTVTWCQARSPRFEVLRRLHAIDATRFHLTMKWVVSFWILRPFDAPRRRTASSCWGCWTRRSTRSIRAK